ncbi:MAG: ATP-dependent 6-phosphofructokinase [Christensenellaceae bacterium]|nr:ATP-dependent 6-phosphofructokinase [Christensenellaceae bacterium]
MANKCNKIAILTSGGDSMGMNACVRAAVRYSLSKNYEIYGVKHGYVGLINDEIEKLDYMSVTNIVHTGGTILKTGRTEEFKKPEVIKKAAENLLDKGIENLIVIGGDGSFRGMQDMSNLTGLKCIGIPGTIDNDLGYTDYTIGFDTAVNTVLDAILKLRDTIRANERIMVIEVMGRNCGDIALYSALAGGAEFLVVPEIPYNLDAIAEGVKYGFEVKGKSSAIVILAEGCKECKEELMRKLRDATGHVVSQVVLSYLQRGGIPSMSDRVLACRLAIRAVDLLGEGQRSRVVGVRGGKVIDLSIDEALAMPKQFNTQLYDIAKVISK